MKIKLILGLLAALMLVEPVAAVAGPANGIAAGDYARLATPLVSDEGAAAKVEKAWWVRRRFWYRPYWRRYGWYRPYWRRRFWYRPFVYRRYFWRRRFRY